MEKKTALMVIDIQQGLFEKPTPIYREEEFLNNVNSLIDHARETGIPVIFIQHSNNDSLILNSHNWQLHPAIQPLKGEKTIYKLHGNAFEKTNLKEILDSQGITDLVITGLVTHGCVRATTQGALKLGYKVILVSDGHSNFSKDAKYIIKKWNQTLNKKGAELVPTAEIVF
jgi:nicotinamidase-related amidase